MDAGSVTFELPDDLPEVGDDSVWYLRLNTYLPTAPQVCRRVLSVIWRLLMLLARCRRCLMRWGRLGLFGRPLEVMDCVNERYM